MKKIFIVGVAVVLLACMHAPVQAQDAGATGGEEKVAVEGGDPNLTSSGDQSIAAPKKKVNDFVQVLFGSGGFGTFIWFLLFCSAGAGVYFSVDAAITVRPKRIMPHALVASVTEAMQEGDVLKGLRACESEPGPLANVLSAGFSHVEEGFEVIQESVATAADLETEKIMQKLTWISVCANLAPMLGLLGTVQGMIMAFANIAEGSPNVAFLALAIAQALYTTAAGLLIAIPCITAYYNFRNSANRTFLKMEAMTMELIKDLRNVEVVES